jgi:hypothetical protein
MLAISIETVVPQRCMPSRASVARVKRMAT